VFLAIEWQSVTYGKVERYFGLFLLDICEEALFRVGSELVCESCRGDVACKKAQKADESQ